MRTLASLFLLPLLVTLAVAQEPAPFEIREGDRVLLLGDTLLERENTYGYLETRMHEQFPDRHFTVRNLSWAGDTPRGISRASFDAPEKGWERLKESIAMVKPTVVFLGYGMAASLQEMTDRSGDITLNQDPTRYGSEPYSVGRFKKEMSELMDVIQAGDQSVRFVLLSPIRHEDLRAVKPGLPDPAAHNALLDQYTKAIEGLAKERSARFVDLFKSLPSMQAQPQNAPQQSLTENAIHLSSAGYQAAAATILSALLPGASSAPSSSDIPSALRAAVLKKNDLFFHRFRPENATYLFGFRKHEQGQNAKEIAMFDPLIEAAEAEIDRLKRAQAADKTKAEEIRVVLTEAKPGKGPITEGVPPPLPDFTVADGYQIALWAQNPLLEKPTQMNWDTQGRLWVCSSSLYPQIAPGQAANDKILIIEDTDRDGTADKSTVFTDDLLIPTAVVPDLVTGKGGVSPDACYVGQSTELLRFEDTDGDGKADTKRVVFSGFGTEDTHHLIHTLRWGPDGRLYFNQSIYIHSHLETPWGMVRLNSGGTFAYDPRSERVEVLFKGFCNPWGLAWDQWGQAFLTDGAGFQGITWGIPGAMYFTYENGRKIAPSISPGSYPKFCGLEIIHSPHFPDDWQGNAITNDFRAHRIVRFSIEDLATGPEPKSGYVTKEQPDLVRTSDQSFRPIDVRLGPDGALYIADWSNPVINHGEVDFRDPRRDKHMGRIWRISKKDAPPVKWEPLLGKKADELLDSLLSKNAWEQQAARTIVTQLSEFPKTAEGLRQAEAYGNIFEAWNDKIGQENGNILGFLESSWLAGISDIDGIGKIAAANILIRLSNANLRSVAARLLGAAAPQLVHAADTVPVKALTKDSPELANPSKALSGLVSDTNPRVSVEAMRALARVQTAESAALVLEAALKAPKDDPLYDYAAWLSINDLAKPWTDAIASGAWKADTAERAKQLEWGLKAIDPALAGATLSRLVTENKVPLDGTGPWIELIGLAGDAATLQPLWDGLLVSFAGDCCETDETRTLAAEGKTPHFKEADGKRATAALLNAARLRNTRPAARTALAPVLFHSAMQEDALRLAGLWKSPTAVEKISELLGQQETSITARRAAVEALRAVGNPAALGVLENLLHPEQAAPVRGAALVAIAQTKLEAGISKAVEILPSLTDEAVALETWRGLMTVKGAPDVLATKLPSNLPKPAAEIGIRAAREAGKNGTKLLAALSAQTGAPPPIAKATVDHKGLAAMAKRDGDPARGETVYRRAQLACVTCHAIGGAGGKVGPDMTSLGASAPLDYIIESVLQPAVKVKEGYNAVNVTLKDGSQALGTQVRETAQEIFLRDATGQEKAVAKAQIASTTNIGSIMPAGLVEALPSRERLDLFAFLGELGKPGPYDASKGTVARVWQLSSEAPAADGTLPANAPTVPAYTLVDGRLLKEQLSEITPLISRGEQPIFATTHFQSSGKTRLKLPGAGKAMLDGKPLALTDDAPLDLAAGVHTLTVKLDPKDLPAMLRAESPDARFLNN